MFRERAAFRERLFQTIELFRQKGATSPDRAMTIEELGLPPRFADLMKGRLGQSGIFVELNGRYYLSKQRLKEVQERIGAGGAIDRSSVQRNQRRMRNAFLLRIVSSIGVTLLLATFILNLFFPSYELRMLSLALLFVLFCLSLVSIYYLTKLRRAVQRGIEYQPA